MKLADMLDLGSNAKACRFKSCHPHQKETSFVYQDKRGFFLLLGENTVETSENSSKQGLERLVIPRQPPFFRSTAAKMRFTFCVSLRCKEVGKTADYGI